MARRSASGAPELLSAALTELQTSATAAESGPRGLVLCSPNALGQVDIQYRVHAIHQSVALESINNLRRDHRFREAGFIDSHLLDLLHGIPQSVYRRALFPCDFQISISNHQSNAPLYDDPSLLLQLSFAGKSVISSCSLESTGSL
ncbi:hypothetical protein AB833_27350 [Chromatiales bacterium (ex Bugula neritina AB1)]|nr:hypothetical protein AB833_27350 [Chromatiales bacterium (ex Bugula neritina AB1)]